jgi:hypothetical protein
MSPKNWHSRSVIKNSETTIGKKTMPIMIFNKVVNRTGKAKDTGNPYSINSAEVMTPFQASETANSKLTGVGLDCVEVQVSDSVFSTLSSAFSDRFKGLPVPLEVETGLSRGGKMIIIGIKS